MSYLKYDEELAKSLSDRLNCTGVTENAKFPKEKNKENYRPRTLIDDTLEYIDPTPNIYTLFVQFNEKFFWNILLPVQVKWSPRMTSCAGICTFHPRNRECIISLSTPLLKLRPRKDLVETLLHEMIHAYLFLINDNRDRDGHGPIFQSHMRRINKEAGTNITIYHSFHEEVRLYQQHWWRCNGPCQHRPPFFGTVKRAMNRAPGQNDFWWQQHQSTCGGQFIKIKEPEKVDKKNSKSKSTNTASKTNKSQDNNGILNWINKSKDSPKIDSTNNKNKARPSNGVMSNTKNNNASNSQVQNNLKKLGNSTNNVHGWGTGGPNSSSSSNENSVVNKSNNSFSSNVPKNNTRMSFSGVLGGSGTGRSRLLDKYVTTSASKIPAKSNDVSLIQSTLSSSSFKVKNSDNIANTQINSIVKCPNCNKSVTDSEINEHLDICLEQTENSSKVINSGKKRKKEDDETPPNKIPKSNNDSLLSDLNCPLCNKELKSHEFNEHLEKCLNNDAEEMSGELSVNDSSFSSVNLEDSPHFCLICNKSLEPNKSLNEHLEECIACVFNDSNNEEFQTNEESKVKSEPLENYPCPSCMTLIKESLMNEHLDICLTQTK